MATVVLPKLFTCKHLFMTCGKRESFVLSACVTQNPGTQEEAAARPSAEASAARLVPAV